MATLLSHIKVGQEFFGGDAVIKYVKDDHILIKTASHSRMRHKNKILSIYLLEKNRQLFVNTDKTEAQKKYVFNTLEEAMNELGLTE